VTTVARFLGRKIERGKRGGGKSATLSLIEVEKKESQTGLA